MSKVVDLNVWRSIQPSAEEKAWENAWSRPVAVALDGTQSLQGDER